MQIGLHNGPKVRLYWLVGAFLEGANMVPPLSALVICRALFLWFLGIGCASSCITLSSNFNTIYDRLLRSEP